MGILHGAFKRVFQGGLFWGSFTGFVERGPLRGHLVVISWWSFRGGGGCHGVLSGGLQGLLKRGPFGSLDGPFRAYFLWDVAQGILHSEFQRDPMAGSFSRVLRGAPCLVSSWMWSWSNLCTSCDSPFPPARSQYSILIAHLGSFHCHAREGSVFLVRVNSTLAPERMPVGVTESCRHSH